MSSTFGGPRSSAELPVAIVQPRHSNSCRPIALSLVNQATTSYVLPIELSAERLPKISNEPAALARGLFTLAREGKCSHDEGNGQVV